MEINEKAISGKVMAWINFGTFPGFMMLSVGRKYDEIIQVLKESKHDADQWSLGISRDKEFFDEGSCFGCERVIKDTETGEEVRLYYVIVTREFDFSDYDMAMLAHEILHICQFYLPKLLDRNREIEAEAYFHTHLFTESLKHLRKGTDILIEKEECESTSGNSPLISQEESSL